MAMNGLGVCTIDAIESTLGLKSGEAIVDSIKGDIVQLYVPVGRGWWIAVTAHIDCMQLTTKVPDQVFEDGLE